MFYKRFRKGLENNFLYLAESAVVPRIPDKCLFNRLLLPEPFIKQKPSRSYEHLCYIAS